MKAAYPIVLSKGKQYIVVYVPDFNISTQGKDEADAMEMARDAIGLTGISPGQIKRIWNVADGTEIKLSDAWYLRMHKNIPFISFGESPVLPDAIDTVIGVELDESY